MWYKCARVLAWAWTFVKLVYVLFDKLPQESAFCRKYYDDQITHVRWERGARKSVYCSSSTGTGTGTGYMACYMYMYMCMDMYMYMCMCMHMYMYMYMYMCACVLC